MDLSSYTLNSSTSLLLLPVFISLVLVSTLTFTTLRYYLSRLKSSQASQKPRPPAFLPYTIPFLGHALSFLHPQPGFFWTHLLTNRIPRAAGSVTLLLAGRVTHVLFSPFAVQTLFKAKNVSRHGFNVEVVQKGFDMREPDLSKFFGLNSHAMYSSKEPAGEEDKRAIIKTADTLQEEMNAEFVLKQSAVNELTSKFVSMLQVQVAKDSTEWTEVSFYKWTRDRMFRASAIAFMGERVLEIYPTLAEDFFILDAQLLKMFFGLPKLVASEGFNARDRALDGLSRWLVAGWQEYHEQGKESLTPRETAWDPIFGARIIQAREALLKEYDLSTRGRASLHLGFLFGLASNAIPATGWMLFHIMSPEADLSLLPRVLAEVKTAQRDDGTLDIPTLISLPLLQSIFHEVLRMYVDVLVSRQVLSDLTLPVDATGQKQVLMKKNTTVIAPSWIGHRDPDPASWGSEQPYNVFFPERFLKLDEKTGKEIFSVSSTSGKFFPFGGGKHICPGRVFAKQEVLASVATIILGFDFEFVGYVSDAGKKTGKFPGLRKGFVGNGVMAMDSDIKVKIKRRA